MADRLPDNAPVTPAEISVFVEAGRYVFKTDDARAIYCFDEDRREESKCVAACATTWRPVTAPPTADTVGDWKAIERTDRSRQWAYKSKPVYTYARDQPGQITGDGVDGRWHVVNP
jgi:predicted lipoprotein with Yx(FWY)xxD motif